MPGWKLVGADMEGLELRALAHYLYPHDGGRYAQIVLSGDPHWENCLAMGLVHGKRDKHNDLHTIMREQGAKRFIYAFVYGCGNAKAGQIVLEACLTAERRGYPEPLREFFPVASGAEELEAVGKRIRNMFLKKTAGMKKLKEKLAKHVSKHGWVPGLDGRRVPVRSEHSALNFLIQSCGAILCKRWLCDAKDELLTRYRHGWKDGQFVTLLWVHDETQTAARDGIETDVGETIVKVARATGAHYNFRVPLDSKYKVGMTWAETH